MKLQSNNLLENLTTKEVRLLTTEMKETVCKNFNQERKRIFTCANLWDIQRRRKNLFTKKFAW